MQLTFLDQLGNWNPQLVRELKGRLKFRNVAIASSLSLLSQLLLFLCFCTQLPIVPPRGEYTEKIYHNYCTGGYDKQTFFSNLCIRDASGNFAIKWQQWHLDLFVSLSLFVLFTLLVAGVYLLVSDLDQEERRGTLNFLRLTPQPTSTILLGKLLGVPILLYLATLLALPLHLWLGLHAQIPFSLILAFYTVLAASCACFYSGALLFGLTTNWISGFQPWLSSGAAFSFLLLAISKPIYSYAADWVNLLSPSASLAALLSEIDRKSNFFWLVEHLENLEWFNLGAGNSVAGVNALLLLGYSFWTYWFWQALLRRFPNPGATMLSKRQSYLFIAIAETLMLGFSLGASSIGDSFFSLFSLNLVLLVGLIAALTPHRQALLDWARYRREHTHPRQFGRNSLLKDLLGNDKSPALVAIALNLLITSVILIPWALLWEEGFFSLIFGLNCILIYAAVAQLFLLMKSHKPTIWAVCMLGGITFLPPVILALLSLTPEKSPLLWLLTVFPAFFSWDALEIASSQTIFFSILGQWLALSILSFQLTRQLRKAGESASKALLAGRPSSAIS